MIRRRIGQNETRWRIYKGGYIYIYIRYAGERETVMIRGARGGREDARLRRSDRIPIEFESSKGARARTVKAISRAS